MILFHIDVNSAFLSWSALKRLKEDPQAVDLRTIPSAVGGDVASRRGVITARSIPAKAFGVKTGEPVVKAVQKCPQLVLVSSDFETYRACSHAFIAILQRYTDRLEQVSVDEAFLDVTEVLQERLAAQGDAEAVQAENVPPRVREAAKELACEIKTAIREEQGFTVNVGIAQNKLLAKMASDFAKPDRVHTLFADEIEEKFWPLPIEDLYGCGKASAARLRNMGLRTIGEVAHTAPEILQAAFGEKHGDYLFRSANGEGSDEVRSTWEGAKSYSNETTTPYDIVASNYETEMPGILKKLCASVARRMQRDDVYASTIFVSAKTNAFFRRSRQTRLPASTNDAARIEEVAAKLLRDLLLSEEGLITEGYGIRLIGVGGSHLDHGEYRQVDLFEALQDLREAEAAAAREQASKEKAERLQKMQAQIAARFGEEVLKKGF